MNQRYLSVILVSALVVCCISCRVSEKPTPPAAEVSISLPISESVLEWDEFSGHLESPQAVNVAARVSGIVINAPFVEGAAVAKGDLLYEIDNRPFVADLASKEAELARAQALFFQAQAHLRRYEKIKGTRAISDEDYDQALAAQQQAHAQIASAKAARENSKLNLELDQGYCTNFW